MTALLSTALLAAAPQTDLPNIVFILADDMGYGDLGRYNPDSKIPTPNMDKLATEGMRFTDAHSPSAVCTPTRYGFMTGRYAWRSRLERGVLWGYSTSLIEAGRTTIASMLKAHGYATGCVGKWHLGFQTGDPANRDSRVDYTKALRPGPLTLGFDYFFGIPASLDMDPYLYVENDQPVEAPTAHIADSAHRRQGGGGFYRGGAIAPSFKHVEVLPTITQKAIAFIERAHQQTPDKPFFLYFPLTAPHTPWLPSEEFIGKSGAGYYGDFTAQVDWSVGQIVQRLDRLGVADNTLLIVTSDNGSHWLPDDIERFGHRSNLNWRGQKADAWEGGHRVPFIARWPGHIQPGTTSDQTLSLTDMFATAAAIVGEEVAESTGEDSENMLPVLLDETVTTPVREALVNHSGNGLFAIRKGDWKLIEGLGSGGFSPPHTEKPSPDGPKGQLYNLREDPGETTNRYLEAPEVVAELTALLESYRRRGHSHAE